jgi:hypothetical protein
MPDRAWPALDPRAVGEVAVLGPAFGAPRELVVGRGCNKVALDASARGRPIYERFDFRAFGSTVRRAGTPTHEPRDSAVAIEPLASTTRDEVLELDAESFGGDRSSVLAILMHGPSMVRAKAFVSPLRPTP